MVSDLAPSPSCPRMHVSLVSHRRSLSLFSPGALGSYPRFPITETADHTGRKTDICNTDLGYTGVVCADCDIYHYKNNLICAPCQGGDQDKIQFIIYAVIAFAVLLIFSVGVAVLSDRYLSMA